MQAQDKTFVVTGAGHGIGREVPLELPPAEAARIIVDKAVEKGDYRVTVGKDATFLDRLSRFAPQRATDMIAKKMASLLG
ncbi:hypothetical protein [Micrococcus endophyticus]|uniref:NAD(P)-dependent dehydrogenase (Short-subunit alcohol dehydrogenase family) n=1 Tax=Micrococcus endophyticus TaxID=455343 RepID=A0A4Y8YEW9_9MICC|nr:hypothetical protein [Micrococcus endophyticus]MBB5849745.1 NAD(P)-dependent dehydrogenase (short-subunit alcohol dehydrogenase family) [Micrococcus endophyticus]TFI32606.1 hypothetical protein E4A41_11920 [Micrococcus endophyticus]